MSRQATTWSWAGTILVMRWYHIGHEVVTYWSWGGAILVMRWCHIGHEVVPYWSWGGSILVMWCHMPLPQSLSIMRKPLKVTSHVDSVPSPPSTGDSSWSCDCSCGCSYKGPIIAHRDGDGLFLSKFFLLFPKPNEIVFLVDIFC